jgi:hypothetical protein
MEPHREAPRQLTLDDTEIEIGCVLVAHHDGRLVRHDARLALWDDESPDADEPSEVATATLWRAQIDHPSFWSTLDAIGSDVYDVFGHLAERFGYRLDGLFGDVGDVVFVEEIVSSEAAAALTVPFVELVLSVVGRGCAGAVAATPANRTDADVLSALGFAPLTREVWSREL